MRRESDLRLRDEGARLRLQVPRRQRRQSLLQLIGVWANDTVPDPARPLLVTASPPPSPPHPTAPRPHRAPEIFLQRDREIGRREREFMGSRACGAGEHYYPVDAFEAKLIGGEKAVRPELLTSTDELAGGSENHPNSGSPDLPISL